LLGQCGNRCEARRVKQAERQERECRDGCREPCCHDLCNVNCIFGIPCYVRKNTHRGYDRFFCCESGQGCCHRLPFPKAEWCKKRSDHAADCRKETVVAVLYHSESSVCKSESSEEPHHYTCEEKNRSGFNNEAFQSFPYMHQYCLCRRNVVLWKLHYERSRLSGKRFCLL